MFRMFPAWQTADGQWKKSLHIDGSGDINKPFFGPRERVAALNTCEPELLWLQTERQMKYR